MIVGFQFEPERDSLQEPLFHEDYENETELEKVRISRVSHAVEELRKCKNCETMLTEKECHQEAASHYLTGDIGGRSRNFAPSNL